MLPICIVNRAVRDMVKQEIELIIDSYHYATLSDEMVTRMIEMLNWGKTRRKW